jgi:hypothetical protein
MVTEAVRTEREDGALAGLKEIGGYMRRDIKTITRWIRQEGFPADRVGGMWVSDTRAIARWRRGRLRKRGRMM